MRIPSQFAKALRTVFNKLHKKHGKLNDETLSEPAEQFVISVLATNDSCRKAKSAYSKIFEEMIDLNELRVTPVPELEELIESCVGDAHKKSQMVTRGLNWLFNLDHTFDLGELRNQTHAELLERFKKIPACHDHARCAMLLLSFGLPVFPVDDQMLGYLIENEALPDEVTVEEASSYIERHFRVGELREFYEHLKAEAEHFKPKPKPKAKAKTKAPAKAVKKTTKKKEKTKKKTTTKKTRAKVQTKKTVAKKTKATKATKKTRKKSTK